jgi:Uma2 family endonuclease
LVGQASREGTASVTSLHAALGALPIAVTPDWVCEVLSPSSLAHDRSRRIYLEHKVPYYWLCDPESRTLEILKHDEALCARPLSRGTAAK